MGIETLLMGALGLTSAVSTLAVKPPKPPAVTTPAATPDAAKEAGAKINIGTADDMKDDTLGNNIDPRYKKKRSTAATVGGLGRGGLAL